MKTASLIIALFLSLMQPIAIHAQAIIIEAEEFSDYHDTDFELIQEATVSGCSGGQVLIGLDYPAEWTGYTFSSDSMAIYKPYLEARGTAGYQYTLQLTITPDTMGSPIIVDFTFTGVGFG